MPFWISQTDFKFSNFGDKALQLPKLKHWNQSEKGIWQGEKELSDFKNLTALLFMNIFWRCHRQPVDVIIKNRDTVLL